MGRSKLNPAVKADRGTVSALLKNAIKNQNYTFEKFKDEVIETIFKSTFSKDYEHVKSETIMSRLDAMLKPNGKGKDKYIQFDFTTPVAKKLSAVIEVLIGFNPYDEFYQLQELRNNPKKAYLNFLIEILRHQNEFLEGLVRIEVDSNKENKFIEFLEQIRKQEYDALKNLFEEE